MGTLIKRIVAVVLSCGALIFAFMINIENSNAIIKTGKGEQIESVVELNEIFKFYNSRKNGNSTMPLTAKSNLKSNNKLNTNILLNKSLDFDIENEDINLDSKYSSVTLTEKSEASISSNSSYYSNISGEGINNTSATSSFSFTREYTMACTREETFYNAKATISSKSSRTSNSKTTSSKNSILMDISIYIINQRSYMLINAFNISGSITKDNETEKVEEYEIINEAFNELTTIGWVEMTEVPELNELINEKDDSNLEIIDWMSNILTKYENDDSVLEQSGDVFSVSKENLESFLYILGLGQLSEDDKYKINLNFNLTNKREPGFDLYCNYKSEDEYTQKYGNTNIIDSSSTISATSSDIGTFSGINATTITIDVSKAPSITKWAEKYDDIL